MVTLDKIYHASFVLKDVARKTDLIAAPRLVPDAEVYLKTENLQVTGSFKVRGAYYKISQLSEEERSHGIVACSAGNHAQGVALAATKMGIKSVVCMPDGAPIMKVESTKRLGAEVCLVKGTYDDAHDKAVELQEETGMTFIHPYDDDAVIAGQGKKVVCLISGGNIDVNILSRVITRGLVMSGRNANLMIALEDKPGQLQQVSEIVSKCGANVVSVHHDRGDTNMAISSCFLKLGLETRDREQIEEIRAALTQAGFRLVTERA